jgi:transposase InsO family protein
MASCRNFGIVLSQSTVAKYMLRRGRPPSQTWRTFLANHVGQVMAADFFVVPTATYRLLFVFVILAHKRRRVMHVAVTDHPTSAWTAQQLRNAFPNEECPTSLLYDRDGAFAGIGGTLATMQIREVVSAARAPWQNAYVERLIGSIRRECLDHVIVVSAAGLRRVMKDYVAYYMRSRTHLSLDKTRPLRDRSCRRRPGASSRSRRSTGCTIATTAPRRTPLSPSQSPVTSLHSAKHNFLARLDVSTRGVR